MASADQKQIIATRLQRIAARNRGLLTPAAVVKDARNKSSPLHKLFEWNDSVAAHKYRLIQARKLIVTVQVPVHIVPEAVRISVYTKDPRIPGNKQGYCSVMSLRDADQAVRLEALKGAMERVLGNLRQAAALAKVLDLQAEFNILLGQAEDLRMRVLAAA